MISWPWTKYCSTGNLSRPASFHHIITLIHCEFLSPFVTDSPEAVLNDHIPGRLLKFNVFWFFFGFHHSGQGPAPKHCKSWTKQKQRNPHDKKKKTNVKEIRDACCCNQESGRKEICYWFWSRLCYCYLNFFLLFG